MEKKNQRSPEEIARDLEDVVLPEISEEDLEDAFGGLGINQQDNNINCGCC